MCETMGHSVSKGISIPPPQEHTHTCALAGLNLYWTRDRSADRQASSSVPMVNGACPVCCVEGAAWHLHGATR